MKRGDVVTAAFQGEHGKPRPAVVLQSDLFAPTLTVTVVPLTSHIREADFLRFTIRPSLTNGLLVDSQAMIDKIGTLSRPKLGRVVGRLDRTDMDAISLRLAVFLGFADPPALALGPT